ncbi:MAG TPA: 1-pyrroline-5-carboxylate dehydrogenase [Thermoplasmata archaeon]|jgi:1-pyrroline-5-carboxylate dehydrogenase|nr:MAG TPA: 1-pyrroline-5-carboxylate dehydrogenase [Thermoplasmata archaeon]
MNETIIHVPKPANEPTYQYAPDSDERKCLLQAIKILRQKETEIMPIIGGKKISTGNLGKVVLPHDHKQVVATYHKVTPELVREAIENAISAKPMWEDFPWEERASIGMKAAELISKKYRFLLNAATMLGQSKNAYQAEIDAACETIDFLRFNAHYMQKIYSDQPDASPGTLNRLEYRPLEGFIFAITPFNFTAIAGNLPTSPAIMGNVIIWKPASTSLLSNNLLMEIFIEAGFPNGVINFLPGSGELIGNIVLKDKRLAGIHFTGSTPVFSMFWKTISDNLHTYDNYPKLVGETGGKDFIFVHPSANVEAVATAMVRGAFEYQGQKCSAASRAYIPCSLWPSVKTLVLTMLKEIKTGDVEDFTNFVNAVIDKAAFDTICDYIEKASQSREAKILIGGKSNSSKGYFIEPTIIETTNPHFLTMEEEIFGPVLTVFVYKDEQFEETLHLCDCTSPYALTGSIFAQDRQAIITATKILRHAAGNFYINDKPTGAVVGQQPFGGARCSGTNDKSGSYLNLLSWVSPRTIKENLLPPTDYKYPFLETEKLKK